MSRPPGLRGAAVPALKMSLSSGAYLARTSRDRDGPLRLVTMTHG